MSQKSLMALFGTNLFLFMQSLEGFFRAGAAAMAFGAGAASLILIIYKDRHTFRAMLGKGGKEQDDQTPVG